MAGKKTVKNCGLEDFPVGQFVPVEAVRVNENNTFDVIIRDSELGEVVARENRRNARKAANKKGKR